MSKGCSRTTKIIFRIIGHVQPCIKCRTWPMVRLPDGTRSPYCGKQCQNSAGVSSPVGSPISSVPLQPQPYRPVNYPPPQSNNPPIGMSQHPMQLLTGGNARPMGGPWVMTTVPFCRHCHVKPCWKNNNSQSYSQYCSRRCKEAAERAPRAVSNMNDALLTSPQNFNGQIVSPDSPISQTNGLLPPQGGIMPQYQQQPPQQSHHPQPNLSSNTRYPENPSSRYPQANDNFQRNDSQQPQTKPQAGDCPNSSGHHIRYPPTNTPISHPNPQSLDNQGPPPIPTNNKPTSKPRSQQTNPMPINTSQPIQSSSQQPTEMPHQGQVQEQNQSHSPVQIQPSQSQVQVQEEQPQVLSQQLNNSQPQPQSQSDEIRPEINENRFMITPYVFNPEDNTDEPPPYTPNDAFTRNVAPGEDISIRKITRDDSFDDENPYGFRNVNNNNSDNQDQNNNQLNNNQSNNNQEQRTHRNILWRR